MRNRVRPEPVNSHGPYSTTPFPPTPVASVVVCPVAIETLRIEAPLTMNSEPPSLAIDPPPKRASVAAQLAEVREAAGRHRAVQPDGPEGGAGGRGGHARDDCGAGVEAPDAVVVGDPHRRAADRDAAQVAEAGRRAGAVGGARHPRA